MKSIILRIRMKLMLEKINKLFETRAWIRNDEVHYVIKNKADLRIAKALQDAGCIKLRFASDGSVYGIIPGERANIYLLERSEIWLNRIISFISGIAMTLITEFLLRH